MLFYEKTINNKTVRAKKKKSLRLTGELKARGRRNNNTFGHAEHWSGYDLRIRFSKCPNEFHKVKVYNFTRTTEIQRSVS